MQFSLFEILAIIIMIQLIVFIIFLFSNKYKASSNRLLGLFLIYQVLFSIPVIARHFGIDQNKLCRFFNTIYLLVPPTIYLYIKSYIDKNFILRISHLKHAIVFVIALILISFETILNSFNLSLTFNGFLNSQYFWAFYYVLLYFQFAVYSIFYFIELNKYKKQVEISGQVHDLNVVWLKIVINGFIFCWVFSATTILRVFFISTNYIEVNSFISTFNFFIFFNILFYKAWSKSQIFTGTDEKPKYKSSDLSKEEAELLLKKLLNHMKDEKPYLNPEISLKELSKQIDVPQRYLSQIINERLHKNFSDFINDYRISEAKALLSNPDCNKTVLEILYYVGFNSKSVFNTVFRKKTGLTPTGFRNMQLEPVYS